MQPPKFSSQWYALIRSPPVPLSALFHRDDGTRNAPGADCPWDSWVSASRTRNYLHADPLLDWLDGYGETKGFIRDDKATGYDARTDFGPFIFGKGAAFEAAVMRHLGGVHRVVTIAGDRADARSEAAVRRTWDPMCAGTEVIAQAPIWNPQTQTYGVIDLLVRSDTLDRLFPGHLANADEPAPDIPGARWHYRVLPQYRHRCQKSTHYRTRSRNSGTHALPAVKMG